MRISDWSSDVCSSDLWCLSHPDRIAIVEVFMKLMLSRIVIASGLLLGSSVVSLAHAADVAVAKPDAAKGEQLYTNGDMSRGILSCASCHGAAGNSTKIGRAHV